MNILFLDWGAFGKEPCIKALETLGHTVERFLHDDYTERKSDAFAEAFDRAVERAKADVMFSFNFYPLVAEGCKRNNLPYIAFVYDNPLVNIFSYTVTYPTNHVYLFDSALCNYMQNGGIPTVHYSPLATEVYDLPTTGAGKGTGQVAFVGALYNEDHNFYDRLEGISPYTHGYLEGVIAAQSLVYGYSFVEEMLTKDILDEMRRVVPYKNSFDGAQTLEYVYGNYFINREITRRERQKLLAKAGEAAPVDLFTLDPNVRIPGVTNHGAVDYYTQMPYVFAQSKINLNITLRSITSGIPLRAMDIMGAGGFLLTNFQEDYLRHFTPGEEFVYFESAEDMQDKIHYYLDHEKERAEIAQNAKKAIASKHTYLIRMQELLTDLKK